MVLYYYNHHHHIFIYIYPTNNNRNSYSPCPPNMSLYGHRFNNTQTRMLDSNLGLASPSSMFSLSPTWHHRHRYLQEISPLQPSIQRSLQFHCFISPPIPCSPFQSCWRLEHPWLVTGGLCYMMCKLVVLRDPIPNWFCAHPSQLVIIDMFMGWTYNLACNLGLCSYVFFHSGAFIVLFIYSLWWEMEEQNIGDGDGNKSLGSQRFKFSDVPIMATITSIFATTLREVQVQKLIWYLFLTNLKKSNGLVFNTVH